jgi:hypothetical protein
VIYGEVVEVTYHPDYVTSDVVHSFGHQDVRFNVLRAFKGAKTGLFGAAFRIDSEATRFTKGWRYLVFASNRDGLWIIGCSRTSAVIVRMEPEEIEQLKELDTRSPLTK